MNRHYLFVGPNFASVRPVLYGAFLEYGTKPKEAS